MRVITGSARGRRLKELTGMETRPTTDKVKESLFSIIQFDIEGRRVLDLFAGTGQLGIEALSRGAASAVFIDRRADAVRLVKDNLELCGLSDLFPDQYEHGMLGLLLQVLQEIHQVYPEKLLS